MTVARFVHYELRTTDLAASRAFYEAILGADFWNAGVSLAPLPAAALARGAVPHWLGRIASDDLDRDLGALVARGAQPLGPVETRDDSSSRASLRDPFGAVVGLLWTPEPPRPAPVVWHLHHGQDYQRTLACYSAVFGWTAAGVEDLGAGLGAHQLFAWAAAGAPIGGMASTATLSHIHAHWMFVFAVADAAAVAETIRRLGGTTSPPVADARGDIVIACEDAQRAAFALRQGSMPSTR